MSPLRPLEEHLSILLAAAADARAAETREPEDVPLLDAVGRVLARDLTALLAVPPFTNSAMDGFALRSGDIEHLPDGAIVLPVSGDDPAGAAPADLVPGTARRIMTGAPLPGGADAIVPVEDTDHSPGPGPAPSTVTITERPVPGRHIRRAAENVAVGEVVLRAGERVGPAHLASVASLGYSSLPVRPRPRVLVVATGDELADPAASLPPGRIPDSNGPLMAALAHAAGAEVVARRRCGDRVPELLGILDELGGRVDVVLTSGGVSAGAHEVVREALSARGVEFSTIAMQPGKPQGFGAVEVSGGRRVLVAALPGNPVSVFVSFHVLVRPVLAVLAGTDPALERRTVPVVVGEPWSVPNGRTQYAPVALRREGDRLIALPAHRLGAGSHLVATLARTDALAIVPAEVTEVRAGDALQALPVGQWLP